MQGELISGLIRKENITLRASIYFLLLHFGYYVSLCLSRAVEFFLLQKFSNIHKNRDKTNKSLYTHH